MHFAVPSQSTRFNQFKPAGSRSFARTNVRRIATYAVGIVFFFWALWALVGGRSQNGKPEVVIVTLVDKGAYSQEYIKKIVENRREYAKIHGYEVYVQDVENYWSGSSYVPWTRIPAMRQMMKTFPRGGHYWYLDQNAIIMNMGLPVTQHIINPKRLDTIMLRNHPVVPSSQIIKTFRGTKAKNVHMIITQDHAGLSLDSFILRNDPWTKYLLDMWWDPIYRFYYNWKGNKLSSSLEHIVQWHPTVLTNLAIIPQREINSYPSFTEGTAGGYQEGDLVINLAGCNEPDSGRNCEKELDRFLEKKVYSR